VPFPLFLFASEAHIENLRQQFVPRGITAALPLTSAGLQQLSELLVTIQRPPRLRLTQPSINSSSGWLLTPEQQDSLRLLFPAEREIVVSDIAGGGAATRRFSVATESHRRYFVKLGRWDNLSAEYRNYLDLIQGKHENYAGRALSPPVARGAEAALCFSLASTGEAEETVSLRKFLQDVDERRGAEFLGNLYSRLVRNLHLAQGSLFAPQKFLPVLPALLTVKNAHFVPPRQDDAIALAFPPLEKDTSGPSMCRFLDQIDAALARKEQPEVLLKGLLIGEVRFDAKADMVILQLTDGVDQQLQAINYKVNVHLATDGQASAGMLFDSLKLHQGRQVWVQGIITETLLSLVRRQQPACDLGKDGDWEPTRQLYDLLFGCQDRTQGTWEASPLTNIADAPLGDFTHGDFNLTNILVEQRRHESPIPWLIDFEKSRGDFYPASDWAKLEVEIATHLTPAFSDPSEQATTHLLALEHSLWCPRYIDGEWLVPDTLRQHEVLPALQKVAKLENTVRMLAAQQLTSQRFVDYLWAVYCHSLRAMGLVSTDLGKLRAYVKATIACKRITQILADS
jgi:hypothetical protein